MSRRGSLNSGERPKTVGHGPTFRFSRLHSSKSHSVLRPETAPLKEVTLNTNQSFFEAIYKRPENKVHVKPSRKLNTEFFHRTAFIVKTGQEEIEDKLKRLE
jgi:hypothetical protein